MKSKKQYIISFFIPIIIFIMVSWITNFIFWGTKIFVVSDARAQYISLFSYLKEVLLGKESLFYSFSKGMGGNMIGTCAYYLTSPLNLLLLFFSKKSLISGLLLLLMLKIGLSGLTMFSFLKSKYKEDKILYLFSTSYALMGYVVVYFFNLMWLDAIYFVPLILIGIDRIINKKSSLMYGICLFGGILSNYYIGYMLCILACLYLGYQLLLTYNLKEHKKEIISVITKFILTSFLAGLMTCFLLLPALYDLIFNIKRTRVINVGNNFNFNFLGIIFSRFFIGSHGKENMLNIGTPALYLGIIILPLVYFYFVNKKIKLKEKILSGIILTFFMLSFLLNNLDLFWHGFSKTNSFDYRYSFLVSLFLIILACQSFYKLKEVDLKHYLLFTIGYVILSNLVIFQNYLFLRTWSIFLSVGLLFLYLVILYVYYRVSKKEQKTLKLLLGFLVFSELFVNFYLSIYKYEYTYKKEYEDSVSIISDKINELAKKDNSFYRIENDIFYSYIDSMLMNYKGVSIFLSTISNNNIQIINNLGHVSFVSNIKYNLDTSPITDSLFGIKYFILRTKIFDYKLVDSFEFYKFSGLLFDLAKEEVGVYENPYALSLGYMVSDNVYDFIDIFKTGKINNVFEVQNYILKTMVKTESTYFESYGMERVDDNNFKIDIKNDKDLYLVVPITIMDEDSKIDIFLNDELVKTYIYRVGGIFRVDNQYENSVVDLKIQANEDEKTVYVPSVYYFNNDSFLEAIVELKKNQLEVIEHKKNRLKGNITVTEDKKVLFTTIPYEKGWTVLVDGKKTDYHKIFDAFIGLDLEVGEHQIEFKFIPPLFSVGLLISIIATILFGLYLKYEKKIINVILKFYFRFEEIINYLIVGGLTTIVSIGSYGFFTRILNLNYIISSILSFILAVIFAYFMNKIFVFKTKFENYNQVLIEMYQFFKYRLLSLGIDLLLMILLVELLQLNDLIAKIIVQVIVVIINYLFSKIFIFKKGIDGEKKNAK